MLRPAGNIAGLAVLLGAGCAEAHPAERAALREEVSRALAQLGPDQREAFLLHYVEGLSYEEMSAVTGSGISALKMRVKRSCERLREILQGVNRV